MNIKALALAATLSVGGLFAGVAPASAATCWFKQNSSSSTMVPTYCSMSKRINANGHWVWDLVDHQGTKVVLVFWTNETVEIIGLPGGTVMGQTWQDSQGDERIRTANGFEMAIRL